MAFLPKNIEIIASNAKNGLGDNLFIKIIIAIVLIALTSAMFPSPEIFEYDYKVGTVWIEKDLIAPFSFPVYKNQAKYENDKKEAISSVHKVFTVDDAVASAQVESLRAYLKYLKSFHEIQNKLKKNPTSADSLKFDNLRLLLPPGITPHDIEAINRTTDLDEMESFLLKTTGDILNRGIINQRHSSIQIREIAIRKGNTETILPVHNYFDLDSALVSIRGKIFERYSKYELASLAIKIVEPVIRPNIIFNQAETDALISAAVENVPLTVGFVQENERIVSKHERITPEIKLKLESFGKAKIDRGTYGERIIRKVGVVFHTTLILLLYGIYIYLFRKRIFHDNSKLAMIAILILMQAFFAHLSVKIDVNAPIQYLIFLPASAMLLTIIFDSRVAFYGTVVMALLIAGIRGNDYDIALASLVAGALAAYTVRDIKHRTQIFRSLVFIFSGYALTIIALSLERFETFTVFLQELTFAFANAVFSPVLTYGLLIFFEKSFRITTDLTLLELSDQNHPLLKILREKASGTFHHSMTIGTLAEAAADAIKANSILARVGGYYHDIGKSLKPEYYAENEVQKKSRHHRLTARMSTLVIISHVKEGMELAREYSLPESVIDFIPQHHGTTLISYFYEKAMKQAAVKKLTVEVREEDYRYPGPKPQSKEAGIVMLADVVEAYTRSMPDPTPEKLESAIDNRIKTRFIEGQLDECELTLRDLTKIKEAFLNILTGIYHQRIEYPKTQITESANDNRQQGEENHNNIRLI
ncbi:MAG: HDIG domain-containing protein [Bacteroidetes bacterium]|nr:HDIG domain-containing protein [Bacteroidota bacterium]MBU1422258.1 HDIG domain-containing protein [Bacteroidota bacterium]MBU2470816.1 HDIG domain-containing protein [Bacteroidota bacterium]MBU2637053.1 HDIG domain-containing protein [Bacteroidota bacterium]